MLFTILYVGVGGFLGSIVRYSIGLLIRNHFTASFPIATLIVNVLGCFLIGLVSAFAQKNDLFQSPHYVFITVGILGGFTTFSAFGLESIELLKTQQFGMALINVSLNMLLGFAAVFIGKYLGST